MSEHEDGEAYEGISVGVDTKSTPFSAAYRLAALICTFGSESCREGG
jgi:hypothetical protein